MTDPTQPTHSPTCYRIHHGCAVARLDRLREALDVAVAFNWSADNSDSPATKGRVSALLVAVRDITEGR